MEVEGDERNKEGADHEEMEQKKGGAAERVR